MVMHHRPLTAWHSQHNGYCNRRMARDGVGDNRNFVIFTYSVSAHSTGTWRDPFPAEGGPRGSRGLLGAGIFARSGGSHEAPVVRWVQPAQRLGRQAVAVALSSGAFTLRLLLLGLLYVIHSWFHSFRSLKIINQLPQYFGVISNMTQRWRCHCCSRRLDPLHLLIELADACILLTQRLDHHRRQSLGRRLVDGCSDADRQVFAQAE